MRPVLLLQIGDQFLQRRARVRHDLQQQQTHQYAVAFGDVAANADAARLFAADQYVFLHHQIGNVIEAHRRFVQRQSCRHGRCDRS